MIAMTLLRIPEAFWMLANIQSSYTFFAIL